MTGKAKLEAAKEMEMVSSTWAGGGIPAAPGWLGFGVVSFLMHWLLLPVGHQMPQVL